MILYLFLILLSYILHHKYIRSQKTDGIIAISVCYFAFFLCCGFMCGSDWRTYETMYNELNLKDPFSDLVLEPGFFAVMYLFKASNLGYWIFSIFIKLICFIVFYRFICKYAGEYRFLALMFFFSFYGIYLLVDGPMRNLCAIAICLYAYSIMENNKIKGFALMGISLLFHSSSLLMILLYFFINRQVSSRTYIICYLFLIGFSFVFTSYMERLVDSPLGLLLMDNSSKFDTYYVKGYNEKALTASPLALGELLKLILFFWIISKRKSFKNIENGNFIFNGAMLFFLVAKFGAMANVLVRLGCYLSPFYAIALCLVTEGVALKMRRLYQNCVFLIAFMLCYTAVIADYRYVPYTNYIAYIITHEDIPNYNFRSSYNHINSPYKDKQLK